MNAFPLPITEAKRWLKNAEAAGFLTKKRRMGYRFCRNR
ncbi:unnamed protein product [Mycetohabitans rhizoxinica HKI 454]|uniref:Uncharacterized protein n=1 Tax=Mycetohabitans rhizoxinica (strain DSM 19002 / CIP 109453 / HKI 454) TaxID=882378 RepID=E5ANE2_MYCRK|nr:unnamed protein product [Mycetohabitans rhizoxinica HKI 454]